VGDWVWLMSSITIIKRATRLVATIIKFNNIMRHSIYVGQGQLERVKEGYCIPLAMLGHGT
jgi:hypothetical protein